LFANAFHDFGDEGNTGVYAGIAFSLGGWASASTGVSHDKDGTAYSASASKALGEAPGSIGWQAGVRQDDQSGGHAAIAYRASKARVEGRVTARGDRATASAALDGSVVAAGGSVFLAQRIDDAFAVVDAGAPDVTVKLENRPVAVTNADGKALVTGLRAHERNKISIDILNLPLDARTETTETYVAPQLRGGVTVDFGVSEEPAAALLVIRRPDGSFVPAGSSGQLASGGEPFFVGYDGQAYVTGLAADNTIILEMPEGACSATFAFTPEPGTQTTIDPVICQ
jgi:outer membrane usher protein